MRKMSARKVIWASVIGNALEFYDFTLYGVFAPLLATIFFPALRPELSILWTLAAFGVGYVTRPLGALVLGYIGDRYGRKKALNYAIVFMAIPTTIIGLLPSYATIGLMAPVILVLCRLLQGLCAGGEYNGAAIFMIEHGDVRRKSFYSSLVATSGAVGALGASLFGGIILMKTDVTWAWRIPFLFGVVLGGVGLYLRTQVQETPEFLKNKADNMGYPLIEVIRKYPASFCAAVLLAALSGSFSSALIVYINTHLSKVVGFQIEKTLFLNSLGLLLYIGISPLMGIVGDRIGVRKTMLGGSIGVLLGAFPVFYLFQTESLPLVILAQVLFACFAAAFISPLNAFLNNLFPVSIRFTGVAFGSNLGKALLGGWMPAISIFLVHQFNNPLLPAFYLMGLGFVAALILFLMDAPDN